MKPVVIFDFDGTIADTFPVVLDIFHKVERRTVPLTKEEEILVRGAALMQVRLRSVFRAAARLRVPTWRLPFIFALSQLILKKRMREVQAFAGMPELIKELSAEDYQLFIVSTNSSGNIKRFLRAQGLNRYFIKVYGNVRPNKKHRTLRHIVKWRRAAAGQVWYVGDEDRDIQAGHAAHLPTVAVTWGYNDIPQLEDAHPDHIITTVQALKELIQSS